MYSNAFGAAFVLAITVQNGELPASTAYFVGSPLAASLLLLRSVTFYIGGLLYTMLLQRAGAVTAVAVTTVRKSLTGERADRGSCGTCALRSGERAKGRN